MRPVDTSNRTVSGVAGDVDPTGLRRPSNNVAPAVVRAVTATTCGADTPRVRGSQEITNCVRPPASRINPTHATIRLLRRSARREMDMALDAAAIDERHSLPS